MNPADYFTIIPEINYNKRMQIREYKQEDISQMIDIFNEVIASGIAFPQEETLTLTTGKDFFESQSYCGVAVLNDEIAGVYIVHPNNVGRCSHIANASYAVASRNRGQHIGEALVKDSLVQAKKFGFKIMQFNAVVETNFAARHLYERLGFIQLGVVENGFRLSNGSFENICPYYKAL